jgi:hypothetical protein
MILTTLFLLLGAVGQDDSKAQGSCEVRVYLIDKQRQAVPVNGISAVLVTQDRTGAEQLLPMTIVTAATDRQKAPNCVLRARPVEGTLYIAALCAISTGGRVKDEPYRDEGGGPATTGRDQDREPPSDAELVTVDFAAPYFKAVIPTEHRCGPGCTTSIRFTIAGSSRSTRTFPCAATWRAGAPTCCAAHQIRAEVSELKRHLQANDREKVSQDLDRISACIERRDGSARTEQRRLECVEACAEARAALTSDFEDEALSAIDRLQEKCEACFEACTSATSD